MHSIPFQWIDDFNQISMDIAAWKTACTKRLALVLSSCTPGLSSAGLMQTCHFCYFLALYQIMLKSEFGAHERPL
jgi:hypothetical protein